MPAAFNTIGLVGRHDDVRVAEPLRALAAHLASRQRRLVVDAPEEFAFPVSVTRLAEGQFAGRVELIVAVGGDGTMLHAARIASAANVPLLGVNRGRLGFLADVGPAEMFESLDDVLAGRFEREPRALLSASLDHEGAQKTGQALNDVVLQKWETGRMLDFETWIDGQYVNTHGGDGLVVATATGSTAYALSCGGPILYPELDALVLAPICPHTLSDRPIVVRGSSTVEVRLVARPDTRAQVTCDGVPLGELVPGDRLVVTPAPTIVTLLHPPEHDYYRILRSKLRWGRGDRMQPTD